MRLFCAGPSQSLKHNCAMNWFLVFLGGGIGSLLRYAISLALNGKAIMPWGTVAANLLATSLLAYLIFHFENTFSEGQRLFWMVGLCGGFSTFSTFSLENWQLIQSQQYFWLSLNLVVSIGLSLLIFFWWAKVAA